MLNFRTLRYNFRHWLFQWKQDQDGDLAFVICNHIAFVKYKEHTIVRFNGHKMKAAPRYLFY